MFRILIVCTLLSIYSAPLAADVSPDDALLFLDFNNDLPDVLKLHRNQSAPQPNSAMR